MTQFEEAARYAVSKIDKKELFDALGIMYETNCPLHMVGNCVIDNMRDYMNEWGNEHGLDDYWWEHYGDEDEALYKGYDLLDDEGYFSNKESQ